MSELRGSLGNLGFVPFVQFLSQQRRTGCLKITQAGLQAEIAFKDGKIVTAVGGAERGEPALELIALALADGNFVYTDATTNPTEPDPNGQTDELQIELQVLVDRVRFEATPVLASVPRIANAVADVDDEELALSRQDIAVLVSVDGRRTTAELLHGQPTLHAIQTLTHLSELGVIRLEPVQSRIAQTESAVSTPEVEIPTHDLELNAGTVVADQTPTNAYRSIETKHLGVPEVRAGPARRWLWVREGIQVIALTVLFVLVLRGLIQSVHVEGQSMLPALHEGEFLLVDRTAYLHDEGSILADVVPFTSQGAMRYPLGGPRRGDVVVVYSPTEPNVELVKRITGLPGESLRITDGQLFVNEIPLREPYLASTEPFAGSYPEDGQSIRIPDDSYFVLGDNRAVSQDSRQGWLLHGSNLIGRAWLAYWPPSDWGFIQHANTVAAATVARGVETGPTAQTESASPAAVLAGTPVALATFTPEADVRQPSFLLSGAVSDQLGWPTDPARTAWFDGPSYRLTANQATRFVAVAAPAPDRLTDVAVTTVFHKVGGPPGGGYGIIVRDAGPGPRDGVNQSGRFYVAEVGDLGEVGIWRRDQDHWIDLVPWTRSDAVYVAGTSNELELRAIGQRLTFIVNGHEVAAIDDAALPDGRVGAFVGGDFNEVVLDRFTLEELSAGVAR